METLKLYHITKKNKKNESNSESIGLKYIVSVNEKIARWNYVRQEDWSSEGYDFTVVDEIEATQNNKLFVILELVFDSSAYNYVSFIDDSKSEEKLNKHWNNAWYCFNKLVLLKDFFNFERLKQKAIEQLTKRDVECDARIKSEQKGKQSNLERLDYIKSLS